MLFTLISLFFVGYIIFNMENKKLLGKRIKELRKAANLTQEKLAEFIGLETSSLSGIESGRHFPSLPTLEKIAKILNIELKSIFDFNHHLPKEKIKDYIIENLDKLSEDKIGFLYKFVEEYTAAK